jgi:hypothetical protein
LQRSPQLLDLGALLSLQFLRQSHKLAQMLDLVSEFVNQALG